MKRLDLVFRDEGDRLVLVGDFDALYRTQRDPWDQSGASGNKFASYYAESRRRLGRVLAGRLRTSGRRLEVGCGHGHVLPLLQQTVRGGVWHGLDISPAAIEQAQLTYPQFTFHVGDIRNAKSVRKLGRARYDAVIISQVLWYILEDLDQAIANACRMLRKGGYLVVSQAFLRGPQRYGAHIADGFHGTLDLFVRRFPELRLVEAHYDDTREHRHHDGLLVFRRVK